MSKYYIWIEYTLICKCTRGPWKSSHQMLYKTSLEIIIIKAIYDTAFIHRQVCPGALFLQFGLMTAPPRAPPLVTTWTSWNQSPASALPGDSAATAWEQEKRSSKGNATAVLSMVLARAHREPLAAAGPGLSTAGSRHAACPKALRSHTPRPRPGHRPTCGAMSLFLQDFKQELYRTCWELRVWDHPFCMGTLVRMGIPPSHGHGHQSQLCGQLLRPQSPLVS